MKNKRVLFTMLVGDPVHKLYKNFIFSSPKGYEYIDRSGKKLVDVASKSQRRADEFSLKYLLWRIKLRSAWLTYKYKVFEEKRYSAAVDKAKPDLIWGINGRIYHGERAWVSDFENPSVFLGFNPVALRKYKKYARELFLKDNCKALICTVPCWKQSFIEIFGKDLAHKVMVVPNIITMPEEKSRVAHRTFNILFTGSVNIDDSFGARGGREVVRAFVKASKLRPGMKLIIRCAVPAQEREILNGVDAEIHEALLPRDELERLFLKSDIYLLPSYTGYALSNLEAMSFGLPIITSDLLDNADVVKEGVTGFRIKTPKLQYAAPRIPDYYFTTRYYAPISQPYIDRIVERLVYAYDHRSEMRKMGKAAREEVKSRSIEQKNRLLKKIYDDALR